MFLSPLQIVCWNLMHTHSVVILRSGAFGKCLGHQSRTHMIGINTPMEETPQSLPGPLHCSVQFSCSATSDSLLTHGLQHTRPPCPSPTPGVYSNSCPLCRWCHEVISTSVVPFSSHLQSCPASGSFRIKSVLQVAKVLEFQLQPSNEHSGLISFRMDWLDLLGVQWTLKSLL